MKRRPPCWLVVTFSLLFASCATVPVTSEHQTADALQFQADPGKAAIYIYGEGSLVGGSNKYPVFLDGHLLGNNGPGTFLAGSVSPGPHVISAGVSQVMLTATSGGIYFVRQTGHATASAANNTTVRLISPDEGKKGVRECKQAASNF